LTSLTARFAALTHRKFGELKNIALYTIGEPLAGTQMCSEMSVIYYYTAAR
jgi:hypothetical protein